MEKKQVYAAAILAASLLVAFLFVSSLYATKDFDSSLQVIIDYEDGTQQTFSPKQLPLFSQSIVDSTGKNVASLRSELYVQVGYSGNVESWSSTGALRWQILDSSKNMKQSILMDMTPASENVAPPKNTPFVVASSTATASNIEALYEGWIPGQTYYLRFEVTNLNFRINFSDGTSQTKSSSAAYEWKFIYQSSNQFSSLSITWQPVTYY